MVEAKVAGTVVVMAEVEAKVVLPVATVNTSSEVPMLPLDFAHLLKR